MSEHMPSDTEEPDRLVEDVLRHAEPRPQPERAARDRAYHGLRSEWLELVRRRRRQRRGIVVALAASLVAAVGIGLLVQQPLPEPGVIASVARLHGDDIRLNGARAAPGPGLEFASGDQLTTGRSSRLAVSWQKTGSMRIDEESSIEFVSAEAIRLLYGAVYYDSLQFGHDGAPSARIRINTALGRITHSGTQFLASTDGNRLAVSVREGTVNVSGPIVDVTLQAGESLDISADGRFSRTTIAPHAARWQWAVDVAPDVPVDGRNVQDILRWIARETGREVRYRSDQARQRAAAAELIGVEPLGPRAALRTIPVASPMQYDINESHIIVDVRDPG